MSPERRRFLWEDAKAEANIAAHDGVTFEEATEVFDDAAHVIVGDGGKAGRLLAIGFSGGARMLTVVHFDDADGTIRIISAWRATATERRLYGEG